MDPVERRLVGRHQNFRHRAIGGHHQLLDQAVGTVAGGRLDRHHPALGIEDQLRLGEVEIEASLLAPFRSKAVSRLRQQLEGIRKRFDLGRPLTSRMLQPLGDLVVGAAATRTDHRRRRPSARQLSVRSHREPDSPGETVHVLAQRAEIVRESLGQHRHAETWQVDRRPTRSCRLVESRAGPHVVADIGDVHLDLDRALLASARAHRVVEVTCRAPVDRDRRLSPQILPAADLLD